MSITRTLLVDADDTLWENNIYFERVAEAFLARLVERGQRLDTVQQILWETEQRNVKITGYGSRAFCQSLHEVAHRLDHNDLEAWIAGQEDWIFHHPIELMPGVAETLPALNAKNRLLLLSKGSREEQLGKLARSGLESYFHHVEIVFEKTVETYHQIAQTYRLDPRHTWMIGNSPRSDINPAKAAGLGAVFIPYHTTWLHEMEEISPNGRMIVLEHFGQLMQYFG